MVARFSSTRLALTVTSTLLIGCLASTAQAQRGFGPGPGGFGPGGGFGHGGHGGGFGPGMGKVLTGEPYSATVTNSSFEKLADGTTISHSDTITEGRDSQGRTFRTVTIPPTGSSTQGFTRTTVMDPVAHTVTEWNSQTKTATQFQLPPNRGDHGPWAGGGPGGPRPDGPGGVGRFHDQVARTALPPQTIAGVSAEGVKTTMTIPAGTEGNDKPIVSTREVWTSPNLKIVLLEKSDDPRDGSHKTEVSSLNPNEPDPTLFQVPSGYTLKTETGHRGR